MLILTKEDVGMYLDDITPSQIWSKQERFEFGILSEDLSSPPKRFANTFIGSEPYMKEIRQKKARILNTIQDKLEQLKEDTNRLPWE